jgi:hypothetical protein
LLIKTFSFCLAKQGKGKTLYVPLLCYKNEVFISKGEVFITKQGVNKGKLYLLAYKKTLQQVCSTATNEVSCK